jgi:bifunctional UDP-N-acetylglucosamine pyrophosphorylase/glucosamine-1-phosphate N-acetyltransferase
MTAAEEVLGVNDRVDLAQAESILRRRINDELMRRGVTFRDPASTYVDDGVEVGADSELGPGVVLRGAVRIGARCIVDAGCVLTNVEVADDSHLKPYTIATDSQLGAGVQVGPFSHLRPGSVLERAVHIGNFVELKKTHVGVGSKANHLAYLGDAEIGANVNVGCGTITCNYDGVAKHQTIIEDGVFIGSDTQLVAPVRVGRQSIIAAGTTVTRDVPADSLTLSRVAQVDKPGYASRLRERQRQASSAAKPSIASTKPQKEG